MTINDDKSNENKIKMFNKFSVVIPTLGGDAIERTIKMINDGTCVPDEILICIPKEFASRVSALTRIVNVKIIATECKGQVRQRVEGFKQVGSDFVVQLDDDIYVDASCMKRLVEGLISMPENTAISPAMIFQESKLSCYEGGYDNSKINGNSRMDKINRLIHGKMGLPPGGISRAGINVGINVLNKNERYTAVEWLPGGCVIHRKKNLILYNYFPFQGKAYYEDVIQSVYLKNKNITLLIDQSAICGIDNYDLSERVGLSEIEIYNKFYSYRKLVLKLSNRSVLFLLLEGFITYAQVMVSTLKSLISSKN